MQYTDITQMARELAWDVSATNPKFTDAALLKYANVVRHEIENSIITVVDEDFFYKTFKVDTVVWQNEYAFQISSGIQTGMKKILSAGIKYTSNDTYYKPIYPCPTNNFDKYIDELKATNNTSNAFFTLKNSSLFVYPTPTEAVTYGLYAEAIVSLQDLTVTSLESEIFPSSELRDYHYIIAMGIVPYIHKILKQYNEASAATNDYKLAMSKMLQEVGERFDSTTQSFSPDGSEFK